MSASATAVVNSSYRPRYIDIGINLADPIFRGRYYGKQRHPDDLASVIQRAHDVGCTKLIVTGSSFKSSRDALELTQEFPGVVLATAGIHPCSSAIFEARHPHHHEADDDEHVAACGADPTQPHADDGEIDATKSAQIVADLHALIETAPASALVAFGEIGLDYDRLHYCSASTQRHSFSTQLALAASLSRPLPLFLHSRACHADFVRLLKEQFGPRLERLACGAVVHSFTGTIAEAEELMDLGLYMGVNGCSLKTAENCEVLKAIRLDRLMIETDGPWCEVRPSHEGWRYLVEAAEAAKVQHAELEAREEQVRQVEQVPATSATEKRTLTPKKSKQPPQQKKEPVVPERFKVVKKEKWEEGVMVKGRNEPCMIERVATIIAAVKGVPVEEVCEAAWANTIKLFGLEDTAQLS
ncbi:deoxyribonuclease [Grosmannia clavigera kw1407]|uniref:Deoxyribonuclease n=1 Tax=Grosmannia clavigera (strain kw1407 / UAMH 11150) TaxID=655863 RepID=F0XA79_GROCL|nr:deoxyribonuclease [Grosmannia clavigera kw1407]EFX05340.1 deoxyribonuclease [Grosmannia clavigera kw1407]